MLRRAATKSLYLFGYLAYITILVGLCGIPSAIWATKCFDSLVGRILGTFAGAVGILICLSAFLGAAFSVSEAVGRRPPPVGGVGDYYYDDGGSGDSDGGD